MLFQLELLYSATTSTVNTIDLGPCSEKNSSAGCCEHLLLAKLQGNALRAYCLALTILTFFSKPYGFLSQVVAETSVVAVTALKLRAKTTTRRIHTRQHSSSAASKPAALMLVLSQD